MKCVPYSWKIVASGMDFDSEWTNSYITLYARVDFIIFCQSLSIVLWIDKQTERCWHKRHLLSLAMTIFVACFCRYSLRAVWQRALSDLRQREARWLWVPSRLSCDCTLLQRCSGWTCVSTPMSAISLSSLR